MSECTVESLPIAVLPAPPQRRSRPNKKKKPRDYSGSVGAVAAPDRRWATPCHFPAGGRIKLLPTHVPWLPSPMSLVPPQHPNGESATGRFCNSHRRRRVSFPLIATTSFLFLLLLVRLRISRFWCSSRVPPSGRYDYCVERTATRPGHRLAALLSFGYAHDNR